MPSLNYKFGDFTFRSDEELLYKANAAVKVTIRSAQVLRVLLENHGRIIGKQEFFDKVWGDACVEDNNLTVAVAQLRKALDESDERKKYIETVPRKGYRFVAPVEKSFADNGESNLSAPVYETGVVNAGNDAAEVMTATNEAAAVESTSSESVENNSDAESNTRLANIRLGEHRETAFRESETSAITATHDNALQPMQRRISRANAKSASSVFAVVASRKVLICAALTLVMLLFGAVWQQSASVVRSERLQAVAVLPFSDTVSSRDTEFYAEKLTQDVTFNLGRLSGVRVPAYDAIAAFDVSDIAVETEGDLARLKANLNVDAVVSGKLQRAKNIINLELELKSLPDGASLWSKHYSFDKRDLTPTHQHIAHDLAAQLARHEPSANSPTTTATTTTTTNDEAYQAYLNARHYATKRSLSDNEKAVQEFTDATLKDSSFADAHSGLATAHIHHGLSLYAARGLAASGQSFPAAKERAQRALQLNGVCDEALTAIAFVAYRYEHDWMSAENNFKRAIELNPNNVLAHRWYGEFLHTRGRFDEGFNNQKIALELEPKSPRILYEIAWGCYLANRLDEAVSYVQTAYAIDKTHAAALYNASEIYEAKGDYQLAMTLWRDAMILEQANRKRIADIEESFQQQGYAGFLKAKIVWLEKLRETNYAYPTDLAKAYATIGERDKAFEWLSASVAARAPDVASLKYAPTFARLRDDRRFPALLERINFSK